MVDTMDPEQRYLEDSKEVCGFGDDKKRRGREDLPVLASTSLVR